MFRYATRVEKFVRIVSRETAFSLLDLLLLNTKGLLMKRKRKGPAVLLLVLILITGFILSCVINARVLRIKEVTIRLPGLDRSLSGTRILFVSDLKITSEADAKRTAKALARICEAGPDMLIIGGDLTGTSLYTSFRRSVFGESPAAAQEDLKYARNVFLSEMNAVSLPLGKYMVMGDEDPAFSGSDSRLFDTVVLNRDSRGIRMGGSTLTLVGYPDYETGSRAFSYASAASFDASGAVIVISHDPRMYNTVPLNIGAYGGKTLILSGHGLNGQVRLFGHSLLYGDINRAYPGDGVYRDESGIPMLVSAGVGSEGLPFRFGTRPTAYLITLEAG